MNKKPDWLGETKSQRSQRVGKRGEKKAITELKAKPVARSGAGRTKGDGRKRVRDHMLHIEHKTTEAGSFSITRYIRSKLLREAGSKRLPFLSITFVRPRQSETWVAMPLWVLSTLLEEEIEL